MLGFEIGQRESGFYSEWTESQTDRITEPSSTVLVYRYTISEEKSNFIIFGILILILILHILNPSKNRMINSAEH